MDKRSDAKKNIVILDTIQFHGGSKVATRSIIQEYDNTDTRFHIITADPLSWQSVDATIHTFSEPRILSRSESGLKYFARHLWIALKIILVCLRLRKVKAIIGASSPGVDLSAYFAGIALNLPVVQFIHGSVANSRTIARCLKHADRVFFLASAETSINTVLSQHISNPTERESLKRERFVEFVNGIPDKHWPSESLDNNNSDISLLWTASILKWKGLDTFCQALKCFPATQTPKSTVCYIRPKVTCLPVSKLPQDIVNMTLLESPDNLDYIRQYANTFVSTSESEPFGLAILEAMAAGLCIVIPADGAYWDVQLTDRVNCFKYQAGDAQDLADTLRFINSNMVLSRSVAAQSQTIAQQYRAAVTYKKIYRNLDELIGLDRHNTASNGSDSLPRTRI